MHKTPFKKHKIYFLPKINFDKKIGLTLLIAIVGYVFHYLFNIELSHAFSTENYGEIQAILSISVFLAHILLLGNATASVKFIPEYIKTKNYSKLHGLVKYYSSHVIVAMILAFFILLIFSFFIQNFTWNNFNFNFDTTWKYLWIAPIFALFIFFYEILMSLNAPFSSLLSHKVFPKFLFLLSFEFFRFFFGTMSLKITICLYSIILAFVILGEVLKINQVVDKKIFTSHDIETDKSWFSTSIRLMFAIILIQNGTGIINLLLKLFGEDSASSIAVLSIVQVLTFCMWISYTACSDLLDSSIAPAAQAKNTTNLQSIINKGNCITFSFGLIIFCIFVFFGKTLLRHFGEFYVSGYVPLLIVAGGNLIGLAAGLSSNILEYALNPKELLFLNLGGGIVIILVGSPLIYLYGLYGGAITFALISAGLTIAYGVALRKRLNLRAFSIF